jgi:hypothetical protein
MLASDRGDFEPVTGQVPLFRSHTKFDVTLAVC